MLPASSENQIMRSNPYQNDSENIFVVSRGDLTRVDIIQSKLIMEMSTTNEKKEIASLQKKLKEVNGNYAGAFFANSFKVDRPIDLLGIAFFGPEPKGKISNYYVKVDIFRSLDRAPAPTLQLAKIRTRVEVDAELFWVDVVQPLHLFPRVWYTIEFCLEGPKTLRCEKTSDVVSVHVEPGNGNVEFVFLGGSKQMPQLKFKLSNVDRKATTDYTKKKTRGCFGRAFR